MNKMLKGGFGLLSYLLFTSVLLGQDSFFRIQKNLEEANYGEVRLAPLSIKMIEVITDLKKERISSFFTVKTSKDMPSVLGSYFVDENQLVFQPRFLPDPDITYQIEFSFESLSNITGIDFGQSIITTTCQFQESKFKETEVLDFFPNADTIPSNILRAYITFSSSMSLGNPYDFIDVVDANGDTLIDAFVVIQSGLWNTDRTRLTLLFHPGRIKRGVGPNVKQGNIFQENETYRLKISADWSDVNGNPLKSSFQKLLYIDPPLRQKLSVDDFEISISKEKGQFIVQLYSHKILDHSLAERMITIKDEKGINIQNLEVINQAHVTTITSKDFRKDVNYTIVINPKLEDIAGNTFVNAFDYEASNLNSNPPIKVQIPITILIK